MDRKRAFYPMLPTRVAISLQTWLMGMKTFGAFIVHVLTGSYPWTIQNNNCKNKTNYFIQEAWKYALTWSYGNIIRGLVSWQMTTPNHANVCWMNHESWHAKCHYYCKNQSLFFFRNWDYILLTVQCPVQFGSSKK